MNRDEPMPTGNEESPTLERANPRDEEMAREQEMARSDDSNNQPVEEHRIAEGRPGDEREVQVPGDPTHADGMMQSELTGYRDRFADLQTRFIDDPKGATEQAGSLLKEAVDRLTESMGNGSDTERKRVGMQRYRRALETIIDQTPV